MVKTKTKVFVDFRGQQYVQEKSHCGNVTIKRNFEVWKG